MTCLTCNLPVTQHPRITAEHVAASAGASHATPLGIRTDAGGRMTVWAVLAPLSPELIGRYWSHDPIVKGMGYLS